MIEDAISNHRPQRVPAAPAPPPPYVPPEPAPVPAPPPPYVPPEPAPVPAPAVHEVATAELMEFLGRPEADVIAALLQAGGDKQRAADILLGNGLPEPAPLPQPSYVPPEPAPAPSYVPPEPAPAPAPAGPVTVEGWAQLDRFKVRDRSHRLKQKLKDLDTTPTAPAQSRVRLADFQIIGDKIGDGANAFVYLARCSPGGQLGDHTDIIVVLKVLHHLKQEANAGGDALVATKSGLDRVFMENVMREAKGPNVEGIRHNIVHVLGTFIDDASSLREYREMMDNLGCVDERTAFIVMPCFSGGDLSKCLEQKKADGQTLAEQTILDYMGQILDAIDKLQRVGNTHRDLKPDNIFLTGAADGVAIADFGEMGLDARPDDERHGGVQLRFTKGTSQAGGAPEYIAPDVLAAIERMEDGATATIDYSKNDVFAAGLICYRMVMTDNSAEPWDAGTRRTTETMRGVPDGRCSDGLRDLIRDMLNPSFEDRVDARTAMTRIFEIQNHGGPGRASQANERVQEQLTPRGHRDSASALSEMMGGQVPQDRVEAALRYSEGNLDRALDMLLQEGAIPGCEPPPGPPPGPPPPRSG